MIIDTHAHAWQRWPYPASVPDAATRGSVETLLYEMDQVGVDRAFVVCAQVDRLHAPTARDDNNNYVAAAAAAHPDRLHVIADVDSYWSASYHQAGAADRLEEAVTTSGAIGAAHYLHDHVDSWLEGAAGHQFLRRAADLGVVLSMHVPPSWFGPLMRALDGVPDATVLIHHQGQVRAESPTASAELEHLAALARHPGTLVKLSGFHYLTSRPWNYPFPETRPVTSTLFETFGPDRLLWGSDFPVARPHVTYRQSLEIVRDHLDLDATTVEAVLGGNARRLLDRLPRTGSGR